MIYSCQLKVGFRFLDLLNVKEDETARTVKEANNSRAYPMFATKKVIDEWRREEEELIRRAQRGSGL